MSSSSVEVLWSIPTILKSQIPWGFLITLLDLQTGKLDVGLRIFQQCENFFGIIVLQFVACPPSRYVIWFYHDYCSSLVAQMVKHLPAMWKTWVWSPGQENPWVWKIFWRKYWQPIPIFLPGKSHGQWSLAGYIQWDCKEMDTTEQLTLYALSFHCSFSFVVGCGYHFLVGSSILLSIVIQQLVAI